MSYNSGFHLLFLPDSKLSADEITQEDERNADNYDRVGYGRSIGKPHGVTIVLKCRLIHENGKYHGVVPLQSLGGYGKNQKQGT